MVARFATLLLGVAASAGAATTARATFGGRRAGGGLHLSYSRRTSHSRFSITYSSGWWGGCCGSRILLPGAFASTGWCAWAPGGVLLYRGWAPRSPRFAKWYPPHVGFGPFEHVDAVVFTGPPAAAVFGYRAPKSPRRQTRRELPQPDLARLPAPKLIDLGDELFGKGEFRRAVDCYRAAVKKAPDDPTAAFALGHGLFAIGSYQEAARELRRALRLFPDIVAVPMRRRDFYGDPKDLEAQLARLADYVGRHPEDAQARFLLAYNYFFSDRRSEAREHFAALGPRDFEAAIFLRSLRARR